jgi:hypothetical protein
VANPLRWQPDGNGATVTGLRFVRTEFPGVYQRGSKFVVVYRAGGRRCKQAAPTFSEACAVRLASDAEARDGRRDRMGRQ